MKTEILLLAALLTLLPAFNSCTREKEKIHIIFDSDTNNELDDQHALAYLLFNDSVFDMEAVTVNATWNGGGIDQQYAEAKRVIKLCGKLGMFPLLKGADRSFNEIYEQVNEDYFDGKDAVEYIIKSAKATGDRRLVIIAVGKLTNIALALEKEPEISKYIRIVWLGSNYPDPGEYNLQNDVDALNFILSTDVPFEMALVRYGQGNGTDAVRVTLNDIRKKMPGIGIKIKTGVTGRNGGEFYNFGDYSVNLFEHAEYNNNDESRALFDMAAAAIVKNPSWAASSEISAPVYENNGWIDQPGNSRKIVIREHFDKDSIIGDFFKTMKSGQ